MSAKGSAKLFASLPALPAMSAFLDRVLPGNAMRQIREQVLEFVASPIARSVLLRGPIGAGKSTLARIIGLLKRVAPLNAEEAGEILRNVKFDGPNQIDLRSIATWYVELPLTGIVESLAEAQLFGADKGAFTGAVSGPGIFERASMGAMPRGQVSIGAALTGGVVFLDEIADLTHSLQTKLLPVLSGGVFYRLGTEGRPNAELTFRGVTIAATWRNLDPSTMRGDLLSRIAGYTIDVPGIDERKEDFNALVDGVQESLRRTIRAEVARMLVVEPKADRAFWTARLESLPALNADAKDELAKVSWGKHGNLRGLTVAVEQMLIGGRDAAEAVSRLPALEDAQVQSPSAFDLVAALLLRKPTGDGLAAHVRAIELDQRRRLRSVVFSDPVVRQKLSRVLGIDESRLRKQLVQLDRERRTESGNQ